MKNSLRILIVVALTALLLCVGLLFPHMGYGDQTKPGVKPAVAHGLKTWNPQTDTWSMDSLAAVPDADIFVIDPAGNVVPGVAFSYTEDKTQVFIVPIDLVDKLLKEEEDRHQRPDPPVVLPDKTVVK